MIFVARGQHAAREKYEAARTKDCVALAISPEEKRACDKDAQSRKDYSHWWDTLVAWPDGITTWALLATLIGIIWQARATAETAIDSAN